VTQVFSFERVASLVPSGGAAGRAIARLRERLTDHQLRAGAASLVRGNISRGQRLLLKAARAGRSEAQFRLGRLYAEGAGVLPNPSDAVYWYRQAAERGHSDARFELSLMHLYGRRSRYEDWFAIARDHDEAGAVDNQKA